MRLKSTLVLMVLALCVGLASPVHADDNPFLKALDGAMQNYAKSFYDAGSPGDVAEQWFRTVAKDPKKIFSLQQYDTTMKAYADANQKVGEQCLADAKAMGKALLDIKSYLPDPLRHAWQALVDNLKALKQRFLDACNNPWGGGGGGGGGGQQNLDAGNDTPAADGALPGDAHASSIRVQKASASDMKAAFEAFVNARLEVSRGYSMTTKINRSDKKDEAQAILIGNIRQMESVLARQLATSPEGVKALADYVKTLSPAVAKGCFTNLLVSLVKVVNAQALQNPKMKAHAEAVVALKKQVTGK